MVSGTGTASFRGSALPVFTKSSAEILNFDTPMVGRSLDRWDVRRNMSFPASTLSFVGGSACLGMERSEKVRLRPGELDSAGATAGR